MNGSVSKIILFSSKLIFDLNTSDVFGDIVDYLLKKIDKDEIEN
jgi:hypothetical protein